MPGVDSNPVPPRPQLPLLGLVSIVSCAFMSTVSTTKAEKAIWNEAETTALIDHLVAHKAEAGDGRNFKNATYNSVLPTLLPLTTAGPMKTAKMCKTKWATVSGYLVY